MEAKGYSREDWQKHYDDNDLGWDLGLSLIHISEPTSPN